MSLDKTNLVALMKQVAKADPSAPVAYTWNNQQLSYAALNETLRNELNELAGTYADYRENKNLIFSLIEETLDEVLPKKVTQQYEQFAEVKTFAQGDKPVFRRPLAGRARAKQFVTRVGLAGIYEVFKLGPTEKESFEVRTSAIGGAAQIGFEEGERKEIGWLVEQSEHTQHLQVKFAFLYECSLWHPKTMIILASESLITDHHNICNNETV